MERSDAFIKGNYYHIYNRGVSKESIFRTDTDWKHFQHLLYTRNGTNHLDSRRVKGLPFDKINRGDSLVDIVAYALMPNHFHLLIHERESNNISVFMSKLATAYAMYFNLKYERSGPLMCRPFRSKCIHSDEYMRWCISYIHTNPLVLNTNNRDNKKFLQYFPYSSYADYFGENRSESLIINTSAIPFDIKELESMAEMDVVLREPIEDKSIHL